MNKYHNSFSEFANDLYDLLGKNGMTQDKFFDKYVDEDRAFMLDEYEDEATIIMDHYLITINPIKN